MAAPRRKKTQSGQEIIEFGLVAIFMIPVFLGTFIVGMNLIRSIQTNQVCRDLTDMYIHGADFSTYPMQQEAQRLAQGLNLQVGPSFSGNSNNNTNNGGKGLVTVTQLMYVGPTTSANCVAVGPGNCTNHDSFVFLQQIQFGNGTLANASTVSLGTPAGASVNSSGHVANPVTDSHAQLPSGAQSAMQSIWASNATTGQQALTDGQVMYVVETYFDSPDLSVGSLAGKGVYARYFY